MRRAVEKAKSILYHKKVVKNNPNAKEVWEIILHNQLNTLKATVIDKNLATDACDNKKDSLSNCETNNFVDKFARILKI